MGNKSRIDIDYIFVVNHKITTNKAISKRNWFVCMSLNENDTRQHKIEQLIPMYVTYWNQRHILLYACRCVKDECFHSNQLFYCCAICTHCISVISRISMRTRTNSKVIHTNLCMTNDNYGPFGSHGMGWQDECGPCFHGIHTKLCTHRPKPNPWFFFLFPFRNILRYMTIPQTFNLYVSAKRPI